MMRVLSYLKCKEIFFMVIITICMYFPSRLLAKSHAGDRVISGVVAAENGLKIPGVCVKIKGTTTGTPTNVNGEYKLKIAGNSAILTFSFIGYLTKKVLGEQSSVNVQLAKNANSQNLNEVVIVPVSYQQYVGLCFFNPVVIKYL